MSDLVSNANTDNANIDGEALPLVDLPALVIQHLGAMLRLRDVFNLMQTCQRMNTLLNHRFIFRIIYFRMYGHSQTICCLFRRIQNHSQDSLKSVARATAPLIERDNVFYLDSPSCLSVRRQLGWPLLNQSVDFCCLHWRALLRRRALIERELVFAPAKRRQMKAAELRRQSIAAERVHEADAQVEQFSDQLQALFDMVKSIDTDNVDGDDNAADVSSVASLSDVQTDDNDEDDDYDDDDDDDDDDGEYDDDDLFPLGDNDNDGYVSDSSVWSVADNYDDYEVFEDFLDYRAMAQAHGHDTAVLADDADNNAVGAGGNGLFQDKYVEFDDISLSNAQDAELERRKIRRHQIFNENYQFGYDDMADCRVYFARANVLSHYLGTHMKADAITNEKDAELQRRYARAWTAACVASEMYASAAVCRARLSNCSCMDHLMQGIDFQRRDAANCVCDNPETWLHARDAAAADNPNERAAYVTPNRKHRRPCAMIDICKEWGSTLVSLARVVALCTYQRGSRRRKDATNDGVDDGDKNVDDLDGSDDDDDDDDASDDAMIAAAAPLEYWYFSPNPTPPEDRKSPDIETYDVDREAVLCDSADNDDVDVPDSVQFLPLEQHYSDSFCSIDVKQLGLQIDELQIDESHADNNEAALPPVKNMSREAEQEAAAAKSPPRIVLDEYAVPDAQSVSVLALLRVAMHRLAQGAVHSTKQLKLLSERVAAIQRVVDAPRGQDSASADAAQALRESSSLFERARRQLHMDELRLDSASHQHMSVLFGVGDVLCEIARRTTGSEFEPLYACACAHYSAVFDGPHRALALDYLGATLDAWARELLNRFCCLLERRARAQTIESHVVTNALQVPTWHDVRRLFVASREQFRLAIAAAPHDVVVLVHWAQSLQNEANERTGATAVRLLLAAVHHLERATAGRADDGFILRCLADARVDTAKALRRLAGDDDSGMMRPQRFEARDPPLPPLVSIEREHPPFSMLDEDDAGVSRRELGFNVQFPMERDAMRALSTEILKQAHEAYAESQRVRPTYLVAFNNHGLALSTLAKWTTDRAQSAKLFEQAYSLFATISTPLAPANYHTVSNLSMTLAAEARILQHAGELDTSRARLRLAIAKLRPLLLKGDAWASFCISRIHAVAGREAECRRWLDRCAHRNYLGRATSSQLAFFDRFSETEWFQRLLANARRLSLAQATIDLRED